MTDHGVTALYFSPTGTTRRIVERIATTVSETLGNGHSFAHVDFTPLAARSRIAKFGERDIVVLGVPVYAGRVPNVLLTYLDSIEGNGALAIGIVAYGNRDYDDALIELVDLLDARSFRVTAAAAFIGEHSFSRTLAKDRPDGQDLELAARFAALAAGKIAGGMSAEKVTVRGNRPYRDYYRPRNKQGEPVDIRKVKPKTSEQCTACGLCAEACPMGSIDKDRSGIVTGICIKCGACVKICPVGAKYYDDPDYLRHKTELEEQFARRREPEFFL